MVEKAERKKRVRRSVNGALLRITIERVETVQKLQKVWNKASDNPDTPYAYVDVVLPVVEKTLLLDQHLPEGKFDMGKVLKAINNL